MYSKADSQTQGRKIEHELLDVLSIADLGLRNADSNPKSEIQNPKSIGTLRTGRVSACCIYFVILQRE